MLQLMPARPVIRLSDLEHAGACYKQVRLFRGTFGAFVPVTVPLARRYAAAFDWHWAADAFLRGRYLENYYNSAQCDDGTGNFTEWPSLWQHYYPRDDEWLRIVTRCAEEFAHQFIQQWEMRYGQH